MPDKAMNETQSLSSTFHSLQLVEVGVIHMQMGWQSKEAAV